MKCDGSCEQHVGEVLPVLVRGHSIPDAGWNFNYCAVAVAEDISRGFTVESAARKPGEK